MEVKGKIKVKKVEGRRRAFMIDGKWYSTFVNDDDYPGFTEAIDAVDKGDSVVLAVYQNEKGFLNINAINGIYKDGKTREVEKEVDVNEDLKEEKTVSGGHDDEAVRIARSVALKEANSWGTTLLINDKEVTKSDVLNLAADYARFILNGIDGID